MMKSNPFILPEETRHNVSSYWRLSPKKRESFRSKVIHENAKIDREREKIVGYAGDLPSPYPWLPPTTIILCKTCYTDKVPKWRRKPDLWEPITKEEYYTQKGTIVHVCTCYDCGKPLVEEETHA